MATVAVQQPNEQSRAGQGPRDAMARRCIASGEVRPKAELLRFVVAPDGRVVLDLAGKLPGRGLWLLPRRDMLDKARARGLFAKAARAQVHVPEDLADQVARSLRERCLNLVGLARRAGVLTVGYEKARSRISRGAAAVLIHAADGATGGRQKLSALARAAMPGLPVVEVFTAAELGRALGREMAVHVILAPGPLAKRFLAEAARCVAVAGNGQ